MSERDREKIEQGQSASFTDSVVGSYISGQFDDTLTRLLNKVRSGEKDINGIYIALGGLIALQDLKATIESDIRQGILAQGREYG